MNFRKLMLTAAVIACTSGAALAQNSQNSWKGFYIGANAGYDWSHSDAATWTVFSPTGYFAQSSVTSIGANGRAKLKPAGFTGGVTAGYNFQFSHFLFGIEADHDYNQASDSRSVTVVYPCCASTGYTIKQDVKSGHLTTLRARLGWAGDKIMVYGTVGGARNRFDYTETFTDTFANAFESSSQSDSKTALVVGVGTEFTVSGHWSMKFDYLHANFGGFTGPGNTLTAYTPAIAFPTNTFTHTANLRTDMARFGINYRF